MHFENQQDVIDVLISAFEVECDDFQLSFVFKSELIIFYVNANSFIFEYIKEFVLLYFKDFN